MDKVKIIAILSNPDSWRSLIYILTAAGIALKPDQIQAITAMGLGISGVLHAFSVSTGNKP